MIRYPAYDPPEYVNWQPDDRLLGEYKERLEEVPERRAIVATLSRAELIALYEGMVRNRLHDIALKRWVKQGVISKAWLGTGEEATTIGPVHALDRKTDIVAPIIRNAGACDEMGMALADMLRGYLGTEDSPTRGRDLHVGDLGLGLLAPISHLGEMVSIAAGVALSFKLRREPRVVLAWAGDGSTKTGSFHEAINFAAVQRLPLIVIIQNNQVALGTRLDQYHRGSFLGMAEAYGVTGWAFDGNNVLDAYAAVKLAADLARTVGPERGPFLLVAETFRMGGHATHDEKEARLTFAGELFEYWGKRDPIGLYEAYLTNADVDLESGLRGESTPDLRERNARMLKSVEERVVGEVERAAEEALTSARNRMPWPESAAHGVYAEIAAEKAVVAAESTPG